MRYVLPALPASGPRGNRARRREAARLAHSAKGRQDAAARRGRLLRRLILQKLFALGSERHSLESAMLTKQQAPELLQEF
jgi:hypothetical protein